MFKNFWPSASNFKSFSRALGYFFSQQVRTILVTKYHFSNCYPGPSNKILPQIESHLISCQYLFINYLVNDKDVKKQDNNNENSDEETLKTPENNNKKQPDMSIGLVKQQQENKEKIEDLLERIEEIFETGGETGEETKKRYKCPICSSTFSHRRYFFQIFFWIFFKSRN